MSPANTTDTIDINLIKILSDGPDVSLKGSPTVSPTTVALCASDPLPPNSPVSTSFFALSHAPPAFAIIIANTNPDANPPANKPSTPATPKMSPVITGTMMAMIDGRIISRCASRVEMATHRA